MTEILCKWINDEVKLSKRVDKSTFAEDFASGYYLGEILHKFQLQDDFDKFSVGQTSDAKLNNFTRLEPTFHLLQIPFNTNIAYNVMMLKHGIATRLLYQLYIAIQRKVKSNLTGAAMETMRASAPVKLEHIESGLYKERLKVLLPRESDLTLDQVSTNFVLKRQKNERRALVERYKEMEAYEKIKQEQRQAALEKSRITRQKQTELLAKIQAATVHIPKPPPSKTLKALNQKRELRRRKAAESAMTNIASFENNMKKLVPPTASQNEEVEEEEEMEMESSTAYLQRIKTRLEEDATAREERAKRRRKVLVDQMKAHQAQEDSLRQEQVVQRLMRQSQQERRIAVQLLQARQEKDTIRKNRIFQEKQNETRRLKDFQDALNREAELCQVVKKDYEDEINREKERHERIMAEKAQEKYRRHYSLCQDTLDSIVDFSFKIAEYRELTEKKVPDKLVREWRELLLLGKPLYDENDDEKAAEIALVREEILDSQDFTEYKNMIGEWHPDEDARVKIAPSNNNILGHILHRMFSMVAPTPPSSPPPVFLEFPVKAAVMGKMFAGKTTIISRLCQHHRLVHLAVDQVLSSVVEAFQEGELDPSAGSALQSSESMEPDLNGTAITIEPPTPAQDPDDMELKLETFEPDSTTTHNVQKKLEYDEEGNLIPPMKDSPKLSKRALLGKHAMHYLKSGEPVPDGILVEIMVAAIHKIPDGSGWVLDGFPTTLQQAILLEKALTGSDVNLDEDVPKRKPSKKSSLVMDPKPVKDQPPIKSGLDVVIVLDVEDELILKRAAGRTEAQHAGEIYHTEFRPPPFGSQTGQGKVEQVVQVRDPAFDREQVQHRLSSFHDNWSKLEALYNKISSVHHVDAEAEFGAVYDDLEHSLFEALDKIQQKNVEPETASKDVVESPKEPQPQPPATEIVETPRSNSGSSKKSKRSSQSPDNKSKSPKGSARGRKKSAEKGEKGKSRSRSGSGKSSKSKKKSRSPTPVPPPEPPAEEDAGPPKPLPGEPDWEYVDETLSIELAQACVPYWENTEKNYTKMTKHMFRKMRAERESIIRYIFHVRKDFKEYLRRPDHKQTFVSSWQKDYNELADDLRMDEESKSELHQRLGDLRERLWDICDTRKEQVESERSNIMTEGWMEDHLGILTNHYLTLMQAEIDRFQDTVRIMKDYYGGMQAKIPVEVGPAGTMVRLPLVDLDVSGQDVSAVQSGVTMASDSSSVSPQASQLDAKKGGKKSNEDLQSDGEGAALPESASRTKIPLVQRGAPITQAADEGAKGKKGKGAPPAQGADSPSHDDILEEKTALEAFNFATNVVTSTVQSRISEKEAEEEEERRVKEEEEKAKAALVPAEKKGGGKKGGGKSAKGKKGGKGGKSKTPTPTPPTPVEEESEEDKRKRETAIRLKEEYFAALQQEEAGVKDRLELIRGRAVHFLTDLRGKADQTFTDMNDWLGGRYLKEMAAIDSLSNVARQHIEKGERLKLEMRLDQDQFIINSERKVLRTPSPPPRPPPVETAQPDIFTLVQLSNLHKQFKDVAPSGIIINKAFIELMADTAALTHGLDALPDMWMNVSYAQLLDLCGLLSLESEYIDWRKFLLLAAQPWPRPSSAQLLEMRKAFTDVDVAGNGWITKDQYDQVSLWFAAEQQSRSISPDDAEEPYPYNRDKNLRNFFFLLFSDWEQMPPRLDYVNMLIYFAMDRDSIKGFFRALGVACGKPMPNFSREANAAGVRQADKEEISEDAASASVPSTNFPPSMYKGMQLDLDASPSSLVSPEMWWLVLHHGSSRLGDSHRFSLSEDPEDKYTMDRIRDVYCELESFDGSPLTIQTLMRHPVFQDAVTSTKRHQCPDIRAIFVQQTLQALENEEMSSEAVGFS
ncbi:sperm flagellar protein 2-like [Clavelina lepadiformis]|uniref:sperm flagellar protein 2-like n=1 Tax=Clavelina lepadiformis TaxID=159417 RepID=UPI004041A7B2